MYVIFKAARFFSEMHIYKPDSNRWYHVTTVSPRSPAAVAGHSASIVGDLMVVFGGSQVPGAGYFHVLLLKSCATVVQTDNT